MLYSSNFLYGQVLEYIFDQYLLDVQNQSPLNFHNTLCKNCVVLYGDWNVIRGVLDIYRGNSISGENKLLVARKNGKERAGGMGQDKLRKTKKRKKKTRKKMQLVLSEIPLFSSKTRGWIWKLDRQRPEKKTFQGIMNIKITTRLLKRGQEKDSGLGNSHFTDT